MKKVLYGALVLAVLLVAFFAAYSWLDTNGKPQTQIVQDNAASKLEGMLRNIKPRTVAARKAAVNLGENELKNELPDISQMYPLVVTGTGEINIEIFSSPEKAASTASKEVDSWMTQMAERFNRAGFSINGKKVSVSLRSISSGLMVDYILSGKYVPDAITPSNEVWPAILLSQNVKMEQIEKRMVGNIAGMLMSPSTNDAFMKKYGEVNAKTVIEATAANETGTGYTSPYTSSTGINFLLCTLFKYDPTNILSESAIKGFEAFQANVPFIAYTTQQMADAASNGSLNAFVSEYQTYINRTDFKGYVFTPFGMRHDNPLYAVGDLSSEKSQLLRMFADYCLTDEAQKLATRYGFNAMDSYVSELPEFGGKDLLAAQSIWKEKKDSGQPVVAVFVADVSGSMNGTSLVNLKSSLVNATQYINTGNYIGLVSYSSDVTINLPIGKFDINQRAYFEGAVSDLTAGGNTATFNAVMVALDMLLKEKEKIPNAKLMIFVLSDGAQNEGYSIESIREILKAYQIPVNTIGYNDTNKILPQLATINEGASINAESENVVYELKNLFNSQM